MKEAPNPRVITRSDPGQLEIEWSNGTQTTYTTAELRGLCPCAQCVDEITGVRQHDPAGVAASLEHRDVRMVGNYAISIDFADGHNTGIFTFAFLHEHDPKA